MDNKNFFQADEEIIDLKELMLFILRKWRILIITGILGILFGCGAYFLLPEKNIDNLDMSTLHLEEIGQYDRYQKLYDEQWIKEKDSIYMNMDPESVFMGSRLYYITAYESDINFISEMYKSILRDEKIYYDLIDVSGLDCSEMAMRELVSITFSKYQYEDKDPLFGKRERDANVNVRVSAPDEESCRGILSLLDERIVEVNNYIETQYPNAAVVLVSESCAAGYDPDVVTMRNESAKLMANYVAEMEKLEKKLTDDDKLYYQKVYGVQLEEQGLGWLKWGLIAGVLGGGAMVAVYGILFLLGGQVKTIDELRRMYGLRLIACMDGGAKNGGCAIDRMLMTKRRYNSGAYLKTVLMEMDAKTVHVCGDMDNAQIAANMKLAADADGVTFSHQMAVDEKAQKMAKAAEGVVFFVQLWSTKHAELLHELEIANSINARVLGVVVID